MVEAYRRRPGRRRKAVCAWIELTKPVFDLLIGITDSDMSQIATLVTKVQIFDPTFVSAKIDLKSPL